MNEAQRVSARCQRYLGDMGINLQMSVRAMEIPKEKRMAKARRSKMKLLFPSATEQSHNKSAHMAGYILVWRWFSMKILSLAWLAISLAIASPAKSDDFMEEKTFFRATIGGRVFRLEGLVVKRADATGPLPIALITHGTNIGSQSRLDTRPQTYLGQARDLAKRGWLAAVVIRRGFGQSDGPMPAPISCRTGSLVERFSADADDLQAALEVLSERPDADPKRVIALGVSEGGAAVVALAARNPQNLLGVINLSGGLSFFDCPKEDELVAAFKTFGATSRIPSLWIYAKNDSLFGPALVDRMRNGFLDGGGDAKLVMFDPIGRDGHFLFSLGEGRYKWLPEMDSFLRAHELPTWQRRDVDVVLNRLGGQERNRTFLENFISAPFEKALAKASGSQYFVSGTWGYASLDQARNQALNICQKEKPNEKCVIVLENETWIAGNR